MSPSERMYALRDLEVSERVERINRKEEFAHATVASALANMVALTLASAAFFVWVAILGTAP
jgi:hypothetical protein